jgi:hypothetical protein
LRPRAVGITILLLSIAILAAAVGLSALGHVGPAFLGHGSLAFSAIPFAISVAGLLLQWVTYRHDISKSARTKLDEVAGELAKSIRQQWDAETRVRRLSDPGYLSVSWEPAAADLLRAGPAW